MKFNLLLFLLVISYLAAFSFGHSCNHDTDTEMQQFYKEFEKNFEEEQKKLRFLSHDKQRLLVAGTSPIRVTADFSGLQTGVITSTQRTYLTSIVKTVMTFLQSFIKIVPTTGNNIFSNGAATTCLPEVTVPVNDKTIGQADSDLHLYIIYSDEPTTSYLANAGLCAFYQTTGIMRPNYGRVKFNIGLMKADGTDRVQFQSDLMVTLHEIIHVLGFSGGSMQYWINPNTNTPYGSAGIAAIKTTSTIRGFATDILSSANVLATSRKYYGCPTLTGMQIENQGGSGSIGSHWERTIIESEVMTASSVTEGSNLTIFTASLLKDTGYWIEVNENLTDPIYWGKGKGCNFPIQACTASGSFEEFSTQNTEGCTFWNDGQGVATKETFSDNCYYISTYSNTLCENSANASHPNNSYSPQFLETYSYNSKCFQSTLRSPTATVSTTFPLRCHQYQCSTDFTQIIISSPSLSGFSFTCQSADSGLQKTVTFNSNSIGTITCPTNYKKFCDNQNCINFCSFNGICIRGNCMCNSGFASDDCSLACPVYSSNGACVASCSAGTYANPNNTCKSTCPNGYYPNDTNSKCTLCDFTCSKCNGPSNAECTACQFLTYLSGNSCVLASACPSATYGDDTSKSCQACPTGCATCTSGTVCGTCLAGFAKSGDLCVNSNCDANCSNCTQVATECTACAAGLYLNSTTKTCVTSANCPTSTFADASNNKCTACSTGCSVCTSPTVCTTCNTGGGYRILGNSCTLCTSPCSTCLPTDVTKCTACESNQYLLNYQCYPNCPSTFYNGSNYQCAGCIAGCNECPNGNVCTTCNTPTYQIFSKNGQNVCITASDCFAPCATCPTSYQPQQCSTCQEGFSLQGNVCQQSCNTGYYSDLNKICQQCTPPCLTCSGTATTCLSCTAPKNLSKGDCVTNCPTGQTAVNNVCTTPIIQSKKTFSEAMHFGIILFYTIMLMFA